MAMPCLRYSVFHNAVDSGQWTVDSGQWTVDSGQWTVDSGQWTVWCAGRKPRVWYAKCYLRLSPQTPDSPLLDSNGV